MSVAVGELPGFASVSDANVCNWYFAVFVLTCVGTLIVAYKTLLPTLFGKISAMAKVSMLVGIMIPLAYALAYAGFQFTMCKRALAV
jgi:hypothetical protein